VSQVSNTRKVPLTITVRTKEPLSLEAYVNLVSVVKESVGIIPESIKVDVPTDRVINLVSSLESEGVTAREVTPMGTPDLVAQWITLIITVHAAAEILEPHVKIVIDALTTKVKELRDKKTNNEKINKDNPVRIVIASPQMEKPQVVKIGDE